MNFVFTHINLRLIQPFFLLVTLAGILMANNALAKAREVRVGVYDNSPKIFTDAAGKPDGMLIDILETVARTEGWQITYVTCEWQECLEKLSDGKIDLMPDVAYSDQRDEVMDFHKTPSLISWTEIYTRDDAHIVSTFDLKGKHIAVLKGSIQEVFFRDLMINFGLKAQLLPVSTLEQGFAAVASGKADAAIANNFFGDFNAARHKLIETPIVYQPVRLYYATAQGRNADLLEPLDRQLAIWLKDPHSPYFAILKKWRGKNPEPFLSRDAWRILSLLIGLIIFLVATTFFLRRKIKMQVRNLIDAHTHLQERTAELAKERDTAQRYLDIAGVMLMALDTDGRISMINSTGVKILGFPESELLGTDWFGKFIPVEKRVALRARFDHLMAGKEQTVEHFENSILTAQNGTLLMNWHDTVLRDDAGQVIGTLSSAEDITLSKQTEADLRIAATAFEAQEGIAITDPDGIILRINQAYTKITGYGGEHAIGRHVSFLKSDHHPAQFYDDISHALARDGAWYGEIWNRDKDGEVHPHRINISSVTGETGCVTHYVCTYVDRTELRRSEDKIKELAFFDQLTSLPNRILLLDRLRQLMTSSARSERFSALLFIDLDNFKTLNDTLGHDMGDLLLRQVAKRLTACVREGDTVARFGGDEYVVILASLSMSESDAAAQTEVVGAKILAALNMPYQLENITYRSSPSIGVTMLCGHRTELDVLFKQAELAMYKSKDAGRNALRFFDPGMEIVVTRRAALDKDLREAVQERQFVLHYQAQIAGGRITGVEALIRWMHPVRSMVPPVEFIPFAEETGLILPIGRWVLESACEQLAKWAGIPGLDHLTIAVNVSAHQFIQTHFVDEVLNTLKKSGANPYLLKLELTESLLVENVEEVVEKMYALKAKGVGFSLDDFGTGYSSLSYLKRLPLDQLKIDQSFVRDVLSVPNDAAIARTIIALAHSLGFGVIAEGVETAEQRDFLSKSGCHAFQGYFFSRPIPVKDFEAFVQAELS